MGFVKIPSRRRSGNQFDPNIAFFIPVSAVFPGASAGVPRLRSLLGELDREDAVFTAAKLNLIVSDRVNDHSIDEHWSIRHQNLQSSLALSFFEPAEVDRIDEFIKKRRAGPGNWQLFFRGQLLELMTWACLLCPNRPELPKIGIDAQARARFAQAALIASELWAERV